MGLMLDATNRLSHLFSCKMCVRVCESGADVSADANPHLFVFAHFIVVLQLALCNFQYCKSHPAHLIFFKWHLIVTARYRNLTWITEKSRSSSKHCVRDLLGVATHFIEFPLNVLRNNEFIHRFRSFIQMSARQVPFECNSRIITRVAHLFRYVSLTPKQIWAPQLVRCIEYVSVCPLYALVQAATGLKENHIHSSEKPHSSIVVYWTVVLLTTHFQRHQEPALSLVLLVLRERLTNRAHMLMKLRGTGIQFIYQIIWLFVKLGRLLTYGQWPGLRYDEEMKIAI